MIVLVYPAGTEIGLEIARALRYQKNITLIGANSKEDHSQFYYDKIYRVPDIYDDPQGAIRELLKIKSTIIYPAHDQVVYELSKAEIDKAILPSNYTAEICRSKKLTYEFLKNIILVPQLFSSVTDITKFPVFCKPECGQGTRGTFTLRNKSEAKRRTNELILEYLPGDEFTVDCFTDRHGNLRYCKGRRRTRITNGISTRTEISDDLRFEEIGVKINSVMAFRGQWFFQVKENTSGELVLMEVAARPAGASCLARARGVNLPLLSVLDKMDINIDLIENDISVADRALENKYIFDYEFDRVYVDLDDTIIPINYEMIGLLYKFKKKGKELILLTSHKGSVMDALKENYICAELFNEIIKTDDKAGQIWGKAIFIDDSFSEREKADCPAFDVQQAIEVL